MTDLTKDQLLDLLDDVAGLLAEDDVDGARALLGVDDDADPDDDSDPDADDDDPDADETE